MEYGLRSQLWRHTVLWMSAVCCFTGSESRHYLYCSIFSTRLLNLNTETVHHLNVFVLCMPHFQAHDVKQQLLTLFVLHESYPYQKLHNILLKCYRVYTRVSHWDFELVKVTQVYSSFSLYDSVIMEYTVYQFQKSFPRNLYAHIEMLQVGRVL